MFEEVYIALTPWCMLLNAGAVAAGYTQVDRTTVTYAVTGDAQPKIFNIMFALGM